MRGNAHVRFGGADRGSGSSARKQPRPGPIPTQKTRKRTGSRLGRRSLSFRRGRQASLAPVGQSPSSMISPSPISSSPGSSPQPAIAPLNNKTATNPAAVRRCILISLPPGLKKHGSWPSHPTPGGAGLGKGDGHHSDAGAGRYQTPRAEALVFGALFQSQVEARHGIEAGLGE